MTDQKETPEQRPEGSRGQTDRIWDATVKTWHTATFRAGQYRRVVQKKIDLTSVHKKISTAHADLGKLIDELHQAGTVDIMATPEVQEQLQKLDSLRSAAALLEEEIVAIKAEEPPPEEEQIPPEASN